jgi:S-DNA-T family DNA segregation ATPase FtsK/SpoIIIE
VAGTADRGGEGLPFAVEESRLEVVSLDLLRGPPHLLVFGDGGCGKSNLLRLIAKGLAARYPAEALGLVVVDPRRGLSDLTALPNLVGYACTTAAVAQVVDHIRRELEDRSAASPELPSEPAMADWPAMATWPVGEADLRTQTGSNGSRTPTRPSFGRPPAPGPPSAEPPAPRRRCLLLVDDYDLLPAANGSLLLPLLDLLGLGREVGLHLVLARRVAGAARAGFEPVVQRLRELGGPGLVMCGDPAEGPVVGGQRAVVLPPGRGYYVCPPRATTLVQVASCPPSAAGRPPRLGGG